MYHQRLSDEAIIKGFRRGDAGMYELMAYEDMDFTKAEIINVMPRQYKVTLLTILLCLVAIEVPADSWDEGNYKPYNTDVVLEKTNLPLLFIDTRDKAGHTTVIHKDYRVAVRMKIISNADGVNYGDTVAHPNQTIDYEGWVGIKYRGSSSFSDSDKKPYGFRTLKTADVNGKKEKGRKGA